MKNRFYLGLAAFLVLLLGISFSVPAKSADIDRLGYTEADQEFYLPEALFVLIQPGVEADVLSVEIPGDRRPEVVFTVTDPGGDSLVPNGADCTRAVQTRFLLTYIPAGEQNKVELIGGRRYEDGARQGGTVADQGDGTWLFKFDTELEEGYDADATYTLGLAARRDLRNCVEGYDLGREAKSVIVNFVPSGNGEPTPRDIVSTESCNRCHNPIAMHGENYPEVQMCTQCHNPGLYSDEYGLSYELSALVHRVHSNQEPQLNEQVHYPAEINDCQVCHTGGTPTVDNSGAEPSAARPLAATPNPITHCGAGFGMTTLAWMADGNVEVRVNAPNGPLMAMAGPEGSVDTGEWVADGTKFYLLDAASGETLQSQTVDLTPYGCVGNAPYDYAAYIGDPAALHSAWMTRPNREACGGCHTYIDWETGEGHPGGPAEDDEFCSFCHQADSGNEFDRSVKGAHTVPLASSVLAGVIVDIKEVTDTGPGQSPTVVFSLNSKNGPIDPATLDRLLFTLSGPNEDFDFYAQENVLGGLTQVGTDWSYTFNAAVPMDAEGSYSVSFEGRIATEVNGEDERDSAENAVVAVAVTDPEPMARRQIVDDAKCEACHSNLSLHGDNRKNATAYCQTCHRWDVTDERRRTEGIPESVHFKYMIHKIHRGAELETKPYVIYGFGNTPHPYDDVHFPGDLRDCNSCHAGDPEDREYVPTFTLPLPAGALPTYAPSAYIPEMGPETATCLSCHDGLSTASHASANTSDLGESCSTCHGVGKTYSVERVHAR